MTPTSDDDRAAAPVEPNAAPRATVRPQDVLHGTLGDTAWPAPKCAAACADKARPGYSPMDASEYVDAPAVLRAKVKLLAQLIRTAAYPTLYTGAGISTASGMPDYASKAQKSVARANASATGGGMNRLQLPPTYTHRVLAALERAGHVSHWVQQNHDGLAQKAGFPHAKLNEIHGSWFDPKHNPVVLMDGGLRKDLLGWLHHWCGRADLCIAAGTSLTTAMTADSLPTTVAERHHRGEALGLVIINLQRTPVDGRAALRINGHCDDVMRLLAKELRLPVEAKGEHPAYCGVKEAAAHRRALKAACEGKGPWP